MFGWFRKNARDEVVLGLYRRTADASRAPWLYLGAGVADTVEGRLESLTLHAFLVLRRLKQLPDPAPDVAQDFVDALFKHVDHGLRELGVGDTAVPKRMKKIAQHVYGRIDAYEAPLAAGDAEALGEAFGRNIPGVVKAQLATYVMEADGRLSELSLDAILKDQPLFHPPEA